MSVRWQVIHLERKTFARGEVTSETITGTVEIVPDPRNRNAALVMRPVEWLVSQNEEHRKRGVPEYRPGSNMDFSVRTILPLSKKEAEEAFTARPGHVLVLKRKSSVFGEAEYNLQRL